jgi:hypothetical protein
MIFVRFFTVFVLSVLIAGCAANPKTLRPVDKIKVGMGVMEVVDLLGVPEKIQTSPDEKDEVWQYCLTERIKPINSVLVIWFYERRVTGIDVYKNPGLGACSIYYRTFDWKDAPHRKKTK